ncbi:hypothetical protein [Cyanobium sp. CH-040]|uniref:hypothetical protein n=1 Tax=Cyanobium sp. CH-040 TaxID=2823708 RepID=UPI0020CCFF3D|nr:hypothetical protein [Cyanobium sp. CH-040]MCP9928821.1 hypothetical protein [Cyanobium sp. CH-040]
MAIPLSGLIDRGSLGFARHLHEQSGRDGIINYWLDTSYMSRAEQRFSTRLFRQIDRLTGITFKATGFRSSDLDVYCVPNLKGRVIGRAVQTRFGARILWEDEGGSRLTSVEKTTIAHELLHTLGLSHPFGDGYNPAYSTRDTVMSYNEQGWFGLTSSDVAALQHVWGA